MRSFHTFFFPRPEDASPREWSHHQTLCRHPSLLLQHNHQGSSYCTSPISASGKPWARDRLQRTHKPEEETFPILYASGKVLKVDQVKFPSKVPLSLCVVDFKRNVRRDPSRRLERKRWKSIIIGKSLWHGPEGWMGERSVPICDQFMRNHNQARRETHKGRFVWNGAIKSYSAGARRTYAPVRLYRRARARVSERQRLKQHLLRNILAQIPDIFPHAH